MATTFVFGKIFYSLWFVVVYLSLVQIGKSFLVAFNVDELSYAESKKVYIGVHF